ncbi:MAG TPA: CAP domain-containing protein [Holophagaceae bacterium]|jgi:uncharacterized protein YkwD|nr:CAP domain-containing protein [Holophagaceae bacterium]
MRPILFSFLIAVHAILPAAPHGEEDPKALARQVVAEINWARQHPESAAAELKVWLPLFEGGRYLAFPGETRLRTEEGPAAVEEAIAFLEKQKPLEPLTWSPSLAKAAEELVRDQSARGGVGHGGSDGSTPESRMDHHARPLGEFGEVATYGSFGQPPAARRAVLALIVDDGVKSRGHRALLFKPGFALAGGAWGPHPRFERVVVVDLAEQVSR